jgi:hypothetical protein
LYLIAALGIEVICPNKVRFLIIILIRLGFKEKTYHPLPQQNNANKRIKKVMKRPNKREAIISPKIIAHTSIGVETNRSKVLACVSNGAITGPIDEATAKRVIPNKPGIKKLRGNFFPMIKR